MLHLRCTPGMNGDSRNIHQPVADGVNDQFGGLMNTESVHDVGAVHGDSVGAEVELLRDLFVRYVVLGHSERRQMFHETDEIVNRKVRAAIEATLRPIVCVGETLDQRERGSVEKILSLQLHGSLAGVSSKDLHETVSAYEPVWAIGTGRNATPEQAQEAHAFIRETLTKLSDATTADRVRIQYGGSVKPENAGALMSQPDIDGALVGGASLDPRSFAQIVQAAAKE